MAPKQQELVQTLRAESPTMRAYLVTYGGSRQIIDARSHDDALRKFQAQRRYAYGRADIRVRPANPAEIAAHTRPDDAA